MHCKECGYKNSEDSKFCQNCGNRLVAHSVLVTKNNVVIRANKNIVSKAVDAVSTTADTALEKN